MYRSRQGREDGNGVKLQSWDHKLPKSILSDHDLRCIPYAISSALHYTTGIPQCDSHHGGLCAMCGNAVRLVVQRVEPMILEAAVTKIAKALGLRQIDLHPPAVIDF